MANNITLPEYQKRMEELISELGFDNESVSDIFLLLVEEIGEFAKAARKNQGIKTHKGSTNPDLEEEAADIFWYLLDLCNHLNIDLEKAFAVKVTKNQKRQWS
jgi:NTP pyrophosphatase (non-canonical NTP hydrolase)